jgi:hypothetical protein
MTRKQILSKTGSEIIKPQPEVVAFIEPEVV